MPTCKPIVEGYVKYRDGKKWKKRYCILTCSKRSLNVLHLYFGKSRDDFSALYEAQSSSENFDTSTTTPSPFGHPSEVKTGPGSSLSNYARPTINMLHSLTAARSNYYCNLPHTHPPPRGYVSDPVTEMCNQADRAILQDLEQSAAAARSRGSPPPLDVVTGFERGCHLNGESNVMLLVGWKTVHAIAHSTVDDMFNWAEVLERYLIDSSYHVTLCRFTGRDGSNSSSSNRLQVGLQASLHVQQWRLCLIGEPSAGCQFIAQWRLGTLDSAYTMAGDPLDSAGGGNNQDSTGHHLGLMSSGVHVLAHSSRGNSIASSYQNEDRFFLEANRDAGKGFSGNYVFQVGGRRLNELSEAVNDLMLRRFPALTAPPGTSVLSTTCETTGKEAMVPVSAAVDIGMRRGCGVTSNGVTSSSLSPPDQSRLEECSSPSLNTVASRFAASSLPGRGGPEIALLAHVSHQNPSTYNQTSSSSCSSTRSKKSSNRQMFSHTVGRSDEIKIPLHRFPCTNVASNNQLKTIDDTVSGHRPTSKICSADGSVDGSPLESTHTKPSAQEAPLYFPSVLVGAGIITSLFPGPPPSSRSELSGGSCLVSSSVKTAAAQTRSRLKTEHTPPPRPLPTSSPAPIVCDRCRRQRHYQHAPSTDAASSEDTGSCVSGSGGVFATDEDFEQQVLKSRHIPTSSIQVQGRDCYRKSRRSLYDLYKHIYRTVNPSSSTPPWKSRTLPSPRPRCRTPDICSSRQSILAHERVLTALGGGEGSVLDQLLQIIAPSFSSTNSSCIFILSFPPRCYWASLSDMDYKWYLIHRLGDCCSRCCLWNTSVFYDLNLQEILDYQNRLLTLKGESNQCDVSSYLAAGLSPCLVTSRLVVWRLTSAPSSSVDSPLRLGNQPCCVNHANSANAVAGRVDGQLPRSWSVHFLGPDEPTDSSTPTVLLPPPPLPRPTATHCSVCGSPVHRSHLRPHVQQSAYVNLARLSYGVSSTLPSLTRRGGPHRHTACVGQTTKTSSKDCTDGFNGRFAQTASTSRSTSLASSPSSPQGQQSYYNLQSVPATSPFPLKPPKFQFTDDRSATVAYTNVPHLAPSTPAGRWMPYPSSTVGNSCRPSNSDSIPDEIREPKRNYALVDLRPSPASSVIAHGDAIGIIPTGVEPASTDSGRGGDTSASTIHTNMSSSSTIVPGKVCPEAGSRRRRTSSHSLTAVLPIPKLNYVHIMSSTSVGKKEIASWDCATSSSTNSSTASSSEKEQHPPTAALGRHLLIMSTTTCIPYAQIDLARTRALNALNGTEFQAPVSGATQSLGTKRVMNTASGLLSLNMRKKSDS